VAATIDGMRALAGFQVNQAELQASGAPMALRRLAERAATAADASRACALADDIENGTAAQHGGAQGQAGGVHPMMGGAPPAGGGGMPPPPWPPVMPGMPPAAGGMPTPAGMPPGCPLQ